VNRITNQEKHMKFSLNRNRAIALVLGGLLSQFWATAGLAQEKSADDVARELTNPNNDLAKLTFKNQFRTYKGDLPNADQQDNYTLLFQPAFPFSMGTDDAGNKEVLFVRPAIPFVVDQPYFDGEDADFGEVTAMGDWGFDLAYGLTKSNGTVMLAGLVGTLPVGTSDRVTGAQLRAGPEAVIGKLSKWGLVGVFPSHQWDVAGMGGTKEQRDAEYSTSSLQLFAVHTAGGGWTYGTEPISSYNWKTNNWTIPLNVYVSKTVLLNKRPWKFEIDLNYYVEQEDVFGPDYMIGFNITPVVDNFVEGWFR